MGERLNRVNRVFARLFGRGRPRSDAHDTQPVVSDTPPSTPAAATPMPAPTETGVAPDVSSIAPAAAPSGPASGEATAQASGPLADEVDEDGADEDIEDEDIEVDDADEEDEEALGAQAGASGRPYVSQAERKAARRLRDRGYFGEETWGVSAAQRRAETDPARLARFNLPVLRSEAELAVWLEIPLARLRWYSHDKPADRTWHYLRYAVPKRGGQGERVILAPKRELKALQRKVLDGIAARVPVAATTHGFVTGRSTLTNAVAHAGKGVVLKLDLKDFFPSVTFARVRGLFVALGYSFAVASTLALLCTEYDRQPFDRDGERYYISVGPRHLVQGAPTSPALANLVAWRLDRRLAGLAAKRGFTYTRYADDLTFSGEDAEAAVRLGGAAQRIIAAEQFTVNGDKTRLLRRGGRQTVTGLVVNERPATPRELRRRLRAILHNAARDGLETQNRDGRSDYAAYLQGMIAYVGAANPRHGEVLRHDLRRLTSAK